MNAVTTNGVCPFRLLGSFYDYSVPQRTRKLHALPAQPNLVELRLDLGEVPDGELAIE